MPKEAIHFPLAHAKDGLFSCINPKGAYYSSAVFSFLHFITAKQKHREKTNFQESFSLF